MIKLITIIEFPSFLSQVGTCISSDERDELIDFLAKHPEIGDEITGLAGSKNSDGLERARENAAD